MKINIEITCYLCDNTYKKEIDVHDWAITDNVIVNRAGLCPTHNVINDFIKKQCTTCDYGWCHYCALWDDFIHSSKILTEADFNLMRSGICPKFSCNGLSDINTNRASKEAGEALEKAIKDYWKKTKMQ